MNTAAGPTVHLLTSPSAGPADVTGSLVEAFLAVDSVEELTEALDATVSLGARLLDRLPVGVVVQAAGGAIISSNAAACRILRLSGDQLRGRTSTDPSWRSVHEDGSPFPGEEHPAMRTLHDGLPHRAVMGVRVAEDSPTWIDVDSHPVTDASGAVAAVVTVFTDITAERAADEKVAQTLYRYEVIASEASDVMLALDASGTVTYATPTARRIIDRDARDLVGTRVEDLVEAHDRDEVGQLVGEVLERFGSAVRRTLPVRLPGDGTHWFELRMKNYLEDPALGRVLVTLIDVDDRVTAEGELRRVNESLERRLDELDRTHRLDSLLSTATDLLVRCENFDEVGDVLWDCVEQAFGGLRATLRVIGPAGGDMVPLRSNAGDTTALQPEDCWSLRTRRVHTSEPGGVRCAHAVGDGCVSCIPVVVDGRVVAVATVEQDQCSDCGPLVQAAASMSTRLSTAVPRSVVPGRR